MYKLLWVAILFFLFSCSSEKPSAVSEQKAQEGTGGAVSGTSQTALTADGSYSIEIKAIPAEATRTSTLFLFVQGFDPAEAEIKWLVNGAAVPNQSGRQFKAEEAKKSDKVQAKVVIKGREVLSNIIQINNSPPVLSKVSFVAEGLKPGEILGVQASANDIDGDEVTLAYEWTKNGEPAGDGRGVTGPLKKGDKLTVRITPFDGEAYGRPVILQREITKMPLIIEAHKKFNFDGKVFTYQVKATDPQGDALAYSLKSSPPGMTIEPSTGLIKWNVPEDFKGKASFEVLVSDGHGSEASQRLSVDIKIENK